MICDMIDTQLDFALFFKYKHKNSLFNRKRFIFKICKIFRITLGASVDKKIHFLKNSKNYRHNSCILLWIKQIVKSEFFFKSLHVMYILKTVQLFFCTVLVLLLDLYLHLYLYLHLIDFVLIYLYLYLLK